MNDSSLTRWYARAKVPNPRQREVALTRHTPMRDLSPIELATIRIQAPDPDTINADLTMVNEAAVRLAVWNQRGALRGESPETIARNLQSFFCVHAHQARRPWRGWDLLGFIDLTADEHGVAVWLDSLTSDPAPHYRPIRLIERLDQLALGK